MCRIIFGSGGRAFPSCHRKRKPDSRLELKPWPGSFCSDIGENIATSWYLSSHRCRNMYWQTVGTT